MSQLSQIKVKVATAFGKIGTTNGTAPPESKKNTFALAYEYFVAKQLKSMAEKREENAKDACRKAGLLGEDYTPGETVTEWTSDLLNIVSKTASPAKRIDPAKLRTELIKALGEKKADVVIDAVTVENKAATQFIFVEKD